MIIVINDEEIMKNENNEMKKWNENNEWRNEENEREIMKWW